MKLTADEIRRIGADWPVPGAEDRIVEVDGKIDLETTLAGLERGLEFYKRELAATRSFRDEWQADGNDVSDHRDSYQAKADELQRAIVAIKAIVARALANGPRPSTPTTVDEWKAEGQRLAKALLDAFLRYDDPEVAAAREAREAEKQRRDAATLEEFYLETGRRSAGETIEKLPVATEFGCASCFRAEAEAAWEAHRKFTRVAELVAQTHIHIHILACPKCGQHCVSVFTETIDWVGGEDPQTWQVLPLTTDEVAALRADPTESRVESFGKGRCCLRFDHPTAGQKQITWSTGPIRIGRHD